MAATNRRVAVIGGGAAGFFGAISAARDPTCEVVLIERARDFLSKVKISGGGRCNVTHACFDPAELAKNYPRGGRELKAAFHRFGPKDTVAWFAGHGVVLKTEADGRMFPVTDDSSTVVDCLMGAAHRAGVDFRPRTQVVSLRPENAGWVLDLGMGTEVFGRVLVATGGLKDPEFWHFTQHKPIPPAPSLFTFRLPEDSVVAGLQGVSTSSARIRIPEMRLESTGPILITHHGLSGPCVLKLSAWGAREMQECNYRFPIQICWQPDFDEHKLRDWMGEQRSQSPAKKLFNTPLPGLSSRLWEALLLNSAVTSETRWTTLTRQQSHAMVENILRCTISVIGKSTHKEEFVTAGGIARNEVDWKTMQSRVHPGLHFAGEVLDVDGVTGGFNFQAAWTTGWIAGNAIADSLA